MTDLALFFEAFHLLRPLWLLMLPVIAGLWWQVRQGHVRRDLPTDGVAPHLRAVEVGRVPRHHHVWTHPHRFMLRSEIGTTSGRVAQAGGCRAAELRCIV